MFSCYKNENESKEEFMSRISDLSNTMQEKCNKDDLYKKMFGNNSQLVR